MVKLKIRIKMKDLMDLLVLGKYMACIDRYDLDQRKLMLVKKALVNGRWKVAGSF